MSTSCQRSYRKQCQRRGIGVQKSQNLVNVVYEQQILLKNAELASAFLMRQFSPKFFKERNRYLDQSGESKWFSLFVRNSS